MKHRMQETRFMRGEHSKVCTTHKNWLVLNRIRRMAINAHWYM